VNEITIIGNVTADPILRMSANGRGVVRFDVAINRQRFNRDTNTYEDLPPVFHRVVAFGPVAQNAAETLRKGLEVVVVGQMAEVIAPACGLPKQTSYESSVTNLQRNPKANRDGVKDVEASTPLAVMATKSVIVAAMFCPSAMQPSRR
jgi:hypothetical protein